VTVRFTSRPVEDVPEPRPEIPAPPGFVKGTRAVSPSWWTRMPRSRSIGAKPGALWQDENGKVIAVCDKNNRWVEVIRLESSPLPTVVVSATTLEATS
jgi:hypothetical protein